LQHLLLLCCKRVIHPPLLLLLLLLLRVLLLLLLLAAATTGLVSPTYTPVGRGSSGCQVAAAAVCSAVHACSSIDGLVDY
jgi:hypothetical protein